MVFEERWLGIDYGEARIGVALSYGTLAEPLEVISGKDWETARDRLQTICNQYRVAGLVVGQSEREMALKSQEFGRWLAHELNLPVQWSDETLSSVEVQRKLRETRRGKKQYTGQIDHFAAAEILSRWLDEQSE